MIRIVVKGKVVNQHIGRFKRLPRMPRASERWISSVYKTFKSTLPRAHAPWKSCAARRRYRDKFNCRLFGFRTHICNFGYKYAIEIDVNENEATRITYEHYGYKLFRVTTTCETSIAQFKKDFAAYISSKQNIPPL